MQRHLGAAIKVRTAQIHLGDAVSAKDGAIAILLTRAIMRLANDGFFYRIDRWCISIVRISRVIRVIRFFRLVGGINRGRWIIRSWRLCRLHTSSGIAHETSVALPSIWAALRGEGVGGSCVVG